MVPGISCMACEHGGLLKGRDSSFGGQKEASWPTRFVSGISEFLLAPLSWGQVWV